ncbi:MAG: hypothetical protein Q4P30_00040 [Eubacteriales bacterium]|nr:hypothetical protein [Eubacteriales bacterium]
MKQKMMALRRQLELIYFKNSNLWMRLARVVVALLIYIHINTVLGVHPTFSRWPVTILLSAAAAFLPLSVTLVLSFGLIAVQLLTLNMVFFAMFIVLLLLMYLLVFRLCYDKWIIVFASILLFWLKMPYLVPLMLGMVFGPSVIVPAAMATVMTFFLQSSATTVSELNLNDPNEMINNIGGTIVRFMKNPEMMTWILVIALTLVVITIVKTFKMKFCKEIALVTGAVFEFLLIIIGNNAFHSSVSIGLAAVLIPVALLIAIIFLWLFIPLDYAKTEYVEFYDDEYYYFVRAVPMLKAKREALREEEGKHRADSNDKPGRNHFGANGVSAQRTPDTATVVADMPGQSK